MCSITVINFCKNNISKDDIEKKNVLEIGSFNVNGSIRNYIEAFKPSKYVGIDIMNGPNVDMVLDAYDIVDKFGKNSFDFVICTEVVEHVKYWQKVFINIKQILKQNGVLVLTTRSKNFPYHGYPYDYWRYEIGDMKDIFIDFNVLNLCNDTSMPGVLVKAQKPKNYKLKEFDHIHLYSILTGTRINRLRWFHYLLQIPINLLYSKVFNYLRHLNSKLRKK